MKSKNSEFDELCRHNCLKLRGTASECEKCPVRKRGFCDPLAEVLARIVNDLKRNFRSVTDLERDDIISDTVLAVIKGIDSFNNRSTFSTWVWRIYKNKRNDCFRRIYRNRSESMSVILNSEEGISEQDKSAYHIWESGNREELSGEIIRILKNNLAEDKRGCARLFLDLFDTFEQGKLQKDLAQAYRIKENTLSRRISRCREQIIHMIEERA